jgi:N-acetyltransferase
MTAASDEDSQSSRSPTRSGITREAPVVANVPILAGRLVVLEPLGLDHSAALLASITSDEVWAWKPAPKPATVDAMRALISDFMIGPSGGRHPLVVIRRDDGLVIGSTTLYSLDLKHLSAELGWTWLDRRCWGHGYNEDMKSVLLAYCFGTLALRRVQWTVDVGNLRSQRAVERLGFVKEGTLRSHRVRTDGSRADTIIYSLLAEEWPATAERLERLIDERMPTVL